MNKTQAIVKLSRIALCGLTEKDDFSELDYQGLIELANKHFIAGIIAKGISSAGLQPGETVLTSLETATQKELFQYLVQIASLPHICNALEAAQIPHIVLKGSRLRRYYPSPELRTSCDIDILVKADDAQLTELMLKLGYQRHEVTDTLISFCQPPAIEIEMHKTLLDDRLEFHSYFNTVWDRAIPVEGKHFEYLLSEEDFYAYMIAHFAKHFKRYGSGIRNVFDIYIYNRFAPESFNKEKAEEILKSIGLLVFEKKMVHLAKVWFENETSTDIDNDLTDYILGCGIYGNPKIENTVQIIHSKNARVQKLLYNLEFITPSYRIMKGQYPVLEKAAILMPVFWVVRWFRVFTPKRKTAFKTLNSYNSINSRYSKYVERILRELELK